MIISPFRALARAIGFLVDLTPRQMQSLCTLSLIGGIIANSFWIYLYVLGVRREAKAGMPFDSPYFEVALDVVQYLAIMSGGFALFMCLIAFGADWLRIKYKDFEAGTGRGEDAAEAAKKTADRMVEASREEAQDIKEEIDQ
ncbi:MAG: hypothetical protein Unbinned4120contig1000_48 [Prokaryotic dsDNA virus sp.]|nr:MAG: hypothetical protein Unbinned4120contig1000_48 [Prokaryotic dsDNA virus sp.]